MPQPHPSTSVRVSIVPSSILAEETRRACAPGSALSFGAPPTELRHDGARGLQRANSDHVKSYFRQRVQNPLRFNLKCGLIAASPARAATPAPRHSRAPAAIPRQSPQNQGGRRLCGGPEAQSCAGDPCCNSAACGPRTPTFRSWKPPLVIARVCTASVHPQGMQSVPCARPFGTCHGGGAHLLQM